MDVKVEIENSKPRYGVLTRGDLTKLFHHQNDLFPGCMSNASIDFTLGDEYFFPKQYHDALAQKAKEKALNDVMDLTDDDKSGILKSQIRNCRGSVLKIPKFTSVVISTHETVDLPNNIAGRFDLRLRWAMAGLVLQVGTQVEPGYKGKLWGLLHNFSGEEVAISYHQEDHRLLTAEFYYISGDSPPSEEKKQKPTTLLQLLEKYPAKSGSLQNYFDEFIGLHTSVQDKIAADTKSLEVLVENFRKTIKSESDDQLKKISEVKEQSDKIHERTIALNNRISDRSMNSTSIILLIVTFIVSIALPIIVNKLTFDKGDYLVIEKSQELRTKIDSITSLLQLTIQKNERLEKEIEQLKKSGAKKESGPKKDE